MKLATILAATILAFGASAEVRYNLPTHEQVADIANAVYTESAQAATNHLALAYDRIAQLGGVRVTNAAERTLAALPDAIYSVTDHDRFAEWLNMPQVLTDVSSAVTNLRGYAFYGCDALKSVMLPNAISIGNYAFRGCSGLTSIDLPNVINIGDYAFSYCNAIRGGKNIKLPAALSIGQNSFSHDGNLFSVMLPEVATVGQYAFDYCPLLEYIFAPKLKSISNQPSSRTNIRFIVVRPQGAIVARNSLSGLFSDTGYRGRLNILCTSDDDGSDGYLAWDGSALVFHAGDPEGYDPTIWDN